MRSYQVAVIPGDGIGRETVPAAVACLEAIADRYEFAFHWRELDWGSDYYRRHSTMMPVNGLDRLADSDAILLGAVGDPELPDAETLWGLLIPIRRTFEQYINLRPARTLAGIESILRADQAIDLVIVRENCEGEYSEVGGRFGRGLPGEMAIQETIFTRSGVARVGAYAVELASHRRCKVTSATKSNGIVHTMPFWDEVIADVAARTPQVELTSVLADALAAGLVLHPERFDVIVASNLLGDILSDLASAVTGSIGIAPSANLNPERKHPSMFEPVHGTAPDIAGQGIANPIGQIWSAAMMLDHLGQPEAAAGLVAAFEQVLIDGVRTPDLGGSATTADFTKAVIAALH